MEFSNDPNHYFYKFSDKGVQNYYMRTLDKPNGKVVAKRNIPSSIFSFIEKYNPSEDIIGLTESHNKMEEEMDKIQERINKLMVKMVETKHKSAETRTKIREHGGNYEQEIIKRNEKLFDPSKIFRDWSNRKPTGHTGPKQEYKPPPKKETPPKQPPPAKIDRIDEYKNLLISVGIFDNPVKISNIDTYEKRWRKWIKINHPDKGGKDTELCAEIVNAWNNRESILKRC